MYTFHTFCDTFATFPLCLAQMLQRISVIGGGLGGLAFAQAMRAIGVGRYEVVVYERDQGPEQRNQGFQIGLNEDGISVLKKLNLPGFQNLICENSTNGFMMTDQHLVPLGRLIVNDSKDNPKASLVNRWRLRDMLTTDLNIQWDKKFVRYEERDEGVVAHFEDGTTSEAGLLIGADGVHSKVRAQYRPDLVFKKTGITAIGGFFPMALDTANALQKCKSFVKQNLGRAMLPHSHSVIFMRFAATDGQENMLWAVSFQTDVASKVFGELPKSDPG